MHFVTGTTCSDAWEPISEESLPARPQVLCCGERASELALTHKSELTAGPPTGHSLSESLPASVHHEDPENKQTPLLLGHTPLGGKATEPRLEAWPRDRLLGC